MKTLAKELWYQDLTDDQYYDMAVNHIVDVWISIWENSGKSSGEMVVTGSMIRPEAAKETAKPAAVFSPSDVLDLNVLGETTGITGTYDESTFDIDKYGKEKEPTGETEEAPLEKKSPEEIENATGTPPPSPGTTPQPETETETPPAEDTPAEGDETGTTP